MATEIIKKDYEIYNENLNLPLNKIFVKKSNGEYISLDKLFVHVQGSDYRKLKNYEDFKTNKNKISYSNLNWSKAAVGDLFYKTFEYSVSQYATKLVNNVTHYLKKDGEENLTDLSNADKFVLADLGLDVLQYVKLGDIYYYEGINKTSISGKTIDDLDGKELYYNGKLIKQLYTDKQYSFKNYKYKIKDSAGVEKEIDAVSEVFDATKLEKTYYSVIFENGAPKLKEDGTVEFTSKTLSVKNGLTTQNYEILIVDDEKNPGKTKEASMVAEKHYKYDANGEFINVLLEGNSKPILVKKSNLTKLDGSALSVDAFDSTSSDYILGNSVKVSINGVDYKTEPLTLEQITVKFTTEKYYSESLSSADALADNAYLRLKDGKHVKEKDVIKQIYYKTVANSVTDFDVYVATVKNKAGESVQIVINKEYLEKAIKGRSSFILDGYTIEVANLKKAKRVANYVDCDVVQTTSKSENIESCKIYASINDQAKTDERDANKAEFEKAYKAGQYELKKAYVYNAETGEYKLEELDERQKRYVYSDTSYRECHSDNTLEYQAMKGVPYVYDAKLGKITGGPHYDVGKGIAGAMKIWGNAVGFGLASLMSPGILVALAAPVLVAGLTTAAVLAPIIIPIQQAIYGHRKNREKKWTDPSKYNEEGWSKELVEALQNLKSKTLELTAEKAATDACGKDFANACHEIDRLVADLSKAEVHEGFELLDGKVDVNTHNAYAICKFMEEAKVEKNIVEKGKITSKQRKKLEKTIADISKKPEHERTQKEKDELAKAQHLFDAYEFCKKYLKLKGKKPSKLTDEETLFLQEGETKYEALKTAFEGKMTHHKVETFETEPSEKTLALTANAQTLKAFLYVKKFTTVNEITIGTQTVQIDRNLLNDLDYDFQNNVFIYKKSVFSFEDCNPVKTKLKGEELTRFKHMLLKLTSVLKSEEINNVIGKPDNVNTEYDIESKLEEVTNLGVECEQIKEQIKATLIDLDPTIYKIVEKLINESETVNTEVQNKINGVDGYHIKPTDLDAIITEATSKRDGLKQTQLNAEDVNSKIQAIEYSFINFENRTSAAYGMLNDSEKALTQTEKDMFISMIDNIRFDVEDSYQDIKTTTDNSKLQQILEAIDNQTTKIIKIREEIDKQRLVNSKEEVIVNINSILQSLKNYINSNPKNDKTKIYIGCVNHIGKIISGFEKEINKSTVSLENAKILNIKAEKIKQLVDVAIDVSKVMNYLDSLGMNSVEMANAKSAVGETIRKIQNIIKDVKLDTSIDDIISKISEARSIYETELMPYLELQKKTKTTRTASRKKTGSAHIATESKLVDALEKKDPVIYNEIINYLMSLNTKTAITNLKAQKLVDKFIATSKTHIANRESLQDAFKSGTYNEIILTKGIPLVGGLVI